MTAPTITHKRGDSLDLLIELPPEIADGYFADWTLKSQIRTPADALIAELDAQFVDAITARHIRLKCLDTSAWPIGPAAFDVQLVRADGHTTSTESAVVYIVKDVTHA